MAQIGYGYGSEFQLLRFLGHHRTLFEKTISDSIHEYGEFHWLDFCFVSQKSSISGDKELSGLSFLKDIIKDEQIFNSLITEYNNSGINKLSSWQSWDAVFTLNGTIYFVEAKARLREMAPKNQKRKNASIDKILAYMKCQLPELPVSDIWVQDCYQLANRLATTALVNKYWPARTLYVFFCNGFSKREVRRFGRNERIVEIENQNASESEFELLFQNELKELGIDKYDLSSILAPIVYIDAEPNIQ